MDFIYGNSDDPETNRDIADFVSLLIFGHVGGFRDYGTLGIVDRGEMIAGVVYYDWDPTAGVIQLSAASLSRRWLQRPVIFKMFDIPFTQFGCQMVVLRVNDSNTGMISIARRYGFSEYLIPRLGGRHENQFLFTLTDDVWREHPMHKDRS